jgi:hypothetical protein
MELATQTTPDLQACLSKCAALITSPDLEQLASTFSRVQADRAARIIQNFWRTVLAARNWRKMRKGFRLFQVIYVHTYLGIAFSSWHKSNLNIGLFNVIVNRP